MRSQHILTCQSKPWKRVGLVIGPSTLAVDEQWATEHLMTFGTLFWVDLTSKRFTATNGMGV